MGSFQLLMELGKFYPADFSILNSHMIALSCRILKPYISKWVRPISPSSTRPMLNDAKIMRMSNRIRSLEEALSTCRCQESTVCHPLLTEELKRIKFGADEESPQSAQKNLTSLREEEILDAAQLLGSFAIEDSGSLKYFGPAARSEVRRPCIHSEKSWINVMF